MLKAEFHVSRVVRLLKQRDDFPNPQDIVLPEADHFSFIPPFPESVGKSLAGPERFDRAAFHEEMNHRAALAGVMTSLWSGIMEASIARVQLVDHPSCSHTILTHARRMAFAP